MNILIDGVAVRGGGVETFLLYLLPELLKIDSDNHYTVIIPESRIQLYQNIVPPNRLVHIPNSVVENCLSRLYYEHITANIFQRKMRFDLHFRIDELVSPFTILLNIPSLCIFHATQHMLIPQYMADSRLKLFYLKRMKALAMRIATIPITVSHHARAELSGLYPFAHERIQVVYHGINHDRFSTVPVSQDLPQINGIEHYLLSVSDRHIHKNYYRLIQAYAALCAAQPVKEHLVLVGRAKDHREETRIQDYVRKNGLERRVHILDYVQQDHLPALYQRATAYVFPSIFETFGFTPLEAMACGTPVICGRYSVMPEICGDAAAYFDPLDVDDITNTLGDALSRPEYLTALQQRGVEHVQQFTWQNAARNYFKLICLASGAK